MNYFTSLLFPLLITFRIGFADRISNKTTFPPLSPHAIILSLIVFTHVSLTRLLIEEMIMLLLLSIKCQKLSLDNNNK